MVYQISLEKVISMVKILPSAWLKFYSAQGQH